jgi:hypothetical protein
VRIRRPQVRVLLGGPSAFAKASPAVAIWRRRAFNRVWGSPESPPDHKRVYAHLRRAMEAGDRWFFFIGEPRGTGPVFRALTTTTTRGGRHI